MNYAELMAVDLVGENIHDMCKYAKLHKSMYKIRIIRIIFELNSIVFRMFQIEFKTYSNIIRMDDSNRLFDE